MSDALLTEISKKLSDIHTALKSAPASAATAGQKNAPDAPNAAAKTAADKADAAAKAKIAADKKAADAEAAKKAAAAAAKKNDGPPSGTKAPGGKHTIDQVRLIIRKVADNKSLGMTSAKEILADDGGGALKIIDLKPEFYDRVYEACEVLINGEGGGTDEPAPEDDDDL